MGWFWADTTPSRPVAPHPIPANADATPPPSCPMHNKSVTPLAPVPATPAGACPYVPPASASAPNNEEPVSSAAPSYVSKLNPLNWMPHSISNTREADEQIIDLPLERETSTIPRGDGTGVWEYPSPQQMYNALLRKGFNDTPAEHVESMVSVHNFLNEGAWDEIKGWEGRFSSGLLAGWNRCAKGEEGYERQVMLETLRRSRTQEDEPDQPSLMRFTGRPKEMTPKARMMQFMSKVFPDDYPNNPPFDRHDWFVQRVMPGGKTKEVRYVIDYYSGPPEPTGEPVFYLDVRPAVDGPTSACERMMRWGGDVWWRASGGSVREELARQKK